MSLIDLKKSKNAPKKKKQFTVDEFIADADNYAQGKAKIVSAEQKNLTLQKAILAAKKKAANKQNNKGESGRRFRHATFTLSESTIENCKNWQIGRASCRERV